MSNACYVRAFYFCNGVYSTISGGLSVISCDDQKDFQGVQCPYQVDSNPDDLKDKVPKSGSG